MFQIHCNIQKIYTKMVCETKKKKVAWKLYSDKNKFPKTSIHFVRLWYDLMYLHPILQKQWNNYSLRRDWSVELVFAFLWVWPSLMNNWIHLKFGQLSEQTWRMESRAIDCMAQLMLVPTYMCEAVTMSL